MKGFIGVQQGEKRGKYNTTGTKQVRLRLDLIESVEKFEGKSLSDKIENILNKLNKKSRHF